MRLVCPNCGAQYEVDDAVIPDAGRDVQCSNCGRGWFQPSAKMLEQEAAQATATADDAPAPQEDPVAAARSEAERLDAERRDAQRIEAERQEAERQATQAATALASDPPAPDRVPTDPEDWDEDPLADEDLALDWDDDDEAEEVPPPAATPAVPDLGDYEEDPDEDTLSPAPLRGTTPRRTLDENLLSVLREEAAREAAHRRAEGTSEMQVQEELNLDADQKPAAPEPPPLPGERRAAVPRTVPDFSDLNDDGDYDDDFAEEDEEPRSTANPRGRERLPDIDEINDSLTATSDRSGETVAEFSPEMAARRRSGFSTGFAVVILIAALLVLLYVFAPRLATQFPAAQAPLASYVQNVDKGRVWLNEQIRALTDKLQPGGDAQ